MLKSMQGNVLVYLVVLILIFGVLGVTIVSLFTTATSSSATPNDSRRAFYVAESGMRFAASELRAHDFDGITIKNLNSKTFTLSDGGSFSINAFSPWFKSQEDFENGSDLRINIPVGELPNTFLVGTTDEVVNFTFINFEFTGSTIPDTGEAVISSISASTSTSMELGLGTDFVANKGEIICLAVHPISDGAVADGGDIEVSLAAKDYFPPRSGAIYIVAETGPLQGDYFYENRIDDPVNNKVILTNITKLPASPAFPINLLTTDYVILSPRNYTIIPSGTSGDVTYGGDMNYAMNIYDTTLASPLARNPDIDAGKMTDNITKHETAAGFIGENTVNDTLNIGGGIATGSNFGAAWFNADMPIGGKTDFCQAGACEFGMGVRVFFVVDVSSQGDGFTFALINGDNNDTTSVGGDIDLGELLGYAGDSRKKSDPIATTDFLDPAGNLTDKGLLPPKMALEFDFYENNGVRDYCIPGDHEGEQTRNDPTASLLVGTGTAINRDVLQYVYWGTTDLNIACKADGNPTTYDDNRHDAVRETEGVWEYPTDFSGSIEKVKSDPTVGPDGTIYFGSDDNNLYALNPDGSEKWSANTGANVQSSPTIDDRGTEATADDIIYVGSDSDKLHAFNSSGSELWNYSLGGNVRTKPALGPTGMVYLGSDGDKFFALNPADRKQDFDAPGSRPFPQATEWAYSTAGAENIKSSAVVNDNHTPDDLSDDTIYVGTDDDSINAFNQQDRAADLSANDGTFPTAREWRFDTGGNAQAGPAVGADGTIYVGADCCDFWAFNHSDRAADLSADDVTFPTANEWEYPPGGLVIDDVRGAPVVASDGTIYFGAAAGIGQGKVYALDPDGNLLWEFPTIGEVFTRPALSPDENTLFVGTENNKVYALNTTDRLYGEAFPSENEWEFTADGKVRAPAVSSDGRTVYVGSEGGAAGGLLYALAGDFAQPKNVRSTFISYSDEFKLDTDPAPTQDQQDNWMNYNDYAIRLEVMRSLEPNQAGKYEYTLRAWARRCENTGCTDSDITGPDAFFQDTRIQYAWFPAPNSFMEQTIKLEEADHLKLERILFGFTGATGNAGGQNAVIKDFQLSFIRPNDPIVTDDREKYPMP